MLRAWRAAMNEAEMVVVGAGAAGAVIASRVTERADRQVLLIEAGPDYGPTGALPEQLPNERALRKVQELYEGRGRGSQLDSARGTAWGLLNAVTEYVDHERRARSNEYRMDSAWFGQGAQIKQRALDAAAQLAA